MLELVAYFQLIANLSALTVIGWIYAAYLKSLRATIELKDVQIQTVEKSLSHLQRQYDELEKRTPEHIEKVLADRIRIREEEVTRLTHDRKQHEKQIKARSRELSKLRLELQKAKDFGRSIVTFDEGLEEEVVVPVSDLELVQMGEVFVDSASLIITDPAHIGTDWHEEKLDACRSMYVDQDTSRIFEFNVDFTHYDSKVDELGMSINEALEKGRVKKVEREVDPSLFTMSYNGAAHATLSASRYGVLRFKNGEEGAGIAFATVYGDGVYRVYGDQHKGRIVRVYIDLQ